MRARAARRSRGGLVGKLIRYAVIVVGLVMIVNAVFGERGLLEFLKARDEYRRLEESLAGARAENARLREEAKRLRDQDPATIEDVARRELGLVRPGEKLFRIRDVPPAGAPAR